LIERNLPSNPQEEIGIRKDTAVTIECAEELDMGDAGTHAAQTPQWEKKQRQTRRKTALIK